MTHCVAVTRGGFGRVWRFETPHDALIHPLIQYGDPVLSSADDLLDEYRVHELPHLLSNLGESSMVTSLVGRIEALTSQGRTTRQVADGLRVEFTHTDVFDAMLRASAEPPDSAARILELVRSDREWDIENRKKRTTIMAEAKKEKAPKAEKAKVEKTVSGHPLTAKLTFGTRKVEDKDVAYAGDEKNNPKRGGAAERFKLYKKGMTIAAAVEAGMSPGNVAHDLEKGYVVVQK